MARIFKEKGISEKEILSYSDTVLFLDEESRDFDKAKLENIVKRAEAHLELDVPSLPLSLFLEFRENGNRRHYEAPYFKRRHMALELGLAEAYEGKHRFTSKLADVVWAIMEESTWIIPAHIKNCSPVYSEFGMPPVFGSDRIHGIDLFSAGTAGVLSFIYGYLKDELASISPIIVQKLEYLLNERLVKPYLNCAFWWTGEKGNAVNNWCPWITSNVLFTIAMLNTDDYTRGRVVRKALDSLDNFIAEYQPDGGCTEGPSYWGAAGASYFDCLELLYDLSGGKINVYGEPLIKAMLEYAPKFNISKKRFINFADCPPTCHHDGIMIRRMGEKCGSEILTSFGDSMAVLDDMKHNGNHIYRSLRNLLRKTPDVASCKAAKNVWFPNLKVMISRESEEAERGIFLAMKGGTNAEQHNHNDVGNFVVYHDGNPVIIDTGAGEYTKKTFSGQRYELWFMQSNYHNLPAFDNVAQLNGIKYASSDEVYDEMTGAVTMQLKSAYPEEAKIVSYKRHAYLDADATIHISEDIELSEEKTVDFRYMICEKPTLVKCGEILLPEGRVMRYDERLLCEIEEFEVNDPGIERNWKTTLLWRIHLSSTFKKDKFEITIK